MEYGSKVIGPCNDRVGLSAGYCVVKWGQKCQTFRDYLSEDLVSADKETQRPVFGLFEVCFGRESDHKLPPRH